MKLGETTKDMAGCLGLVSSFLHARTDLGSRDLAVTGNRFARDVNLNLEELQSEMLPLMKASFPSRCLGQMTTRSLVYLVHHALSSALLPKVQSLEFACWRGLTDYQNGERWAQRTTAT